MISLNKIQNDNDIWFDRLRLKFRYEFSIKKKCILKHKDKIYKQKVEF